MQISNLVKLKIPYFAMPVSAGFPSPAADYMGDFIDLNAEYIKNPSSTFIIDCEGHSMIEAFIPPKARLLVDRSLTPQDGNIILAFVEGKFTVKYLKKTFNKCFLIAANEKFEPIEISGEMELIVFGVVTTIISLPKNNRTCLP